MQKGIRIGTIILGQYPDIYSSRPTSRPLGPLGLMASLCTLGNSQERLDKSQEPGSHPPRVLLTNLCDDLCDSVWRLCGGPNRTQIWPDLGHVLDVWWTVLKGNHPCTRSHTVNNTITTVHKPRPKWDTEMSPCTTHYEPE